MLKGKNILLIISGGIAAYKSLELIRLIKKSGAHVRCILTNGGAQFITPLSVASLSEEHVYTDLWSLKDESEMGHVRLSREADLIIVAPASANMIAKISHGIGDDLASTTLLAANKPVMIAPAMNPEMWHNQAVQDNIKTLQKRGIQQIGPMQGKMACGETGLGRMAEPEDILQAASDFFQEDLPLSGYTALVTSGPTYEPLDPVRFIGNHSSGKQGHAIAQSLYDAGATVTLISGPVNIPPPEGINVIRVNTASEMLEACENTLPVDIAVCAAAVSDWSSAQPVEHKIKKLGNAKPPEISLKENPDILATIAQKPSNRPKLVIGFVAETENLIENAKEKLAKKKCDWIIANQVNETNNVFGSEENQIHLITKTSNREFPKSSKKVIANQIVKEVIEYFDEPDLKLVKTAAE